MPTPDELSRLIAESIEPLAEVITMDPHWIVPGQYSPKQCWRFQFNNGTPRTIEWVFCDFVTDPAMTLMLLGQMPPNSAIDIVHYAEGLTVRAKEGMNYKVTFELPTVEFIGKGKTIGEAVALAYARWKGLLK